MSARRLDAIVILVALWVILALALASTLALDGGASALAW